MELIITRNGMDYCVQFDDEDSEIVKDLNFQIKMDKYNSPYVFESKNGKMANKVIIQQKPNEITIHKNGDKLDLRKENLLVVTKKELSSLIRNGDIKTESQEDGVLMYVCQNK